MFGHHAKELLAVGAAVVGGTFLYKKFFHGTAAPSSPVVPAPQPAAPPAPAPAPPTYNPGTLVGPNPGDTNGLTTYNPVATEENQPVTNQGYGSGAVDDTSGYNSAVGDAVDASSAIDAITNLGSLL